MKSAAVQKTTRLYTAGEKLDTDDIRIMVQAENGSTEAVTEYTVTNADDDRHEHNRYKGTECFL